MFLTYSENNANNGYYCCYDRNKKQNKTKKQKRLQDIIYNVDIYHEIRQILVFFFFLTRKTGVRNVLIITP